MEELLSGIHSSLPLLRGLECQRISSVTLEAEMKLARLTAAATAAAPHKEGRPQRRRRCTAPVINEMPRGEGRGREQRKQAEEQSAQLQRVRGRGALTKTRTGERRADGLLAAAPAAEPRLQRQAREWTAQRAVSTSGSRGSASSGIEERARVRERERSACCLSRNVVRINVAARGRRSSASKDGV